MTPNDLFGPEPPSSLTPAVNNPALMSGLGSQVDKAAHALGPKTDASLARRQGHEVFFKTPYVGPSGASLTGYIWPHNLVAGVDKHGEDKVLRVSDWSQAEVNPMTERKIVHQFIVNANGKEHLLSAESAAIALGVSQSTVRSNVMKLLDAEIKAKRTENAYWESVDKLRQGPWFPTPATAIENAAPPVLVASAIDRARSWGQSARNYHERTGTPLRYQDFGLDTVPPLVQGPKGFSPLSLPFHRELSSQIDAQERWHTVSMHSRDVWDERGNDRLAQPVAKLEFELS